MRMLVIQHASCEPPAAYEDEMRERAIELEFVEIDEGQRLPDWRDFDAIVAMGGPMGADDDARLPWLVQEKLCIGEAVRAGLPYWGVCLGAQLLAASLGARVSRGVRPEIGVYHDVELTSEARADAVFAQAPTTFTTLQWHGDTFELPDGARLLASSRAYPHQAFAWRRAYGLQFHLEASSALAAQWLEVPAYEQEAARELDAAAFEAFSGELAELDAAPALARELFGRWVERVVAAPG